MEGGLERLTTEQDGLEVFKELSSGAGTGRLDWQGRPGLRYPGGSNRVVCYLNTSDRRHLLQGEEKRAGEQGADAWRKKKVKG